MADKVTTPASTDGDPGQAGKPAPDKNAELTAQIQAIQETLKRLDSGFAGQRSLYDRQLNELRGQLRTALTRRDRSSEIDDSGSYDTRAAQTPRADIDPSVEHLRMNQEILKFQFEHPEYLDLKEKVDALLNDNVKVHSVLTYNDAGKIDYYRTYRVALLEIQNGIYRESKAAADAARAEAEKNRRQSKADATLSGVGAEELPQDISLDDLENMTAEEMEEKGLVPGLSPQKKRPAPVGIRR